MFAWITWFCSALLIDAYRYPNTDGEKRNYTYIQAVKRYLGEALPFVWLHTTCSLPRTCENDSSILLERALHCWKCARHMTARHVTDMFFVVCRWKILHRLWSCPMSVLSSPYVNLFAAWMFLEHVTETHLDELPASRR